MYQDWLDEYYEIINSKDNWEDKIDEISELVKKQQEEISRLNAEIHYYHTNLYGIKRGEKDNASN